MNFKKYLKYAVGSIWVVLLFVMIVITIIEKIYGTDYAQSEFYSSLSFLSLWFVFAVLSCIYIIQRQLYRKHIIFMLHSALLTILIGAVITWFFSERGRIKLSTNQSTDMFVDEEGNNHKLPFIVTLADFSIEYYKGTSTPMNFISTLNIKENGSKGDDNAVVSMNNIYSYNNYRFYQTGYDGDTTILNVYYDPYGIAITYTGYILLLLSMILFMFSKQSYFRHLLRKVSLRSSIMIFLVSLSLSTVRASDNNSPQVLPKSIASDFCSLHIFYNERVCPIQTFAKEFTRKIYGDDNYLNLTPEQILTGWIFYYDSWKDIPLIEIKSDNVRRIMNLKNDYATLQDYFTSHNEYCLKESLKKIRQGEDIADKRGFIEADEKFVIISQVATGAALKIFPHIMKEGKSLNWYNQVGELPSDLDHKEWVFIRKSLDYLNEKIIMKDWQEAQHIIDKIKTYQIKKSKGMLPSEEIIKAEYIYNKIEYTRILAMIVLAFGVSSLIMLFVCLVKNRLMNKKTNRVIDGFIILAWGYLTIIMCLRGIISGHLPLSNGYETMQFMAWCTMLLTLVFRNKYIFIRPFGLLISGFALLVSMLGISNPQITPLMPVLSSPLLSIHVMVIMISYALLSCVMLNGIMAFLVYNMRGKDEHLLSQFKDISMVMLYPAVFLLAIGIFIGAVWANVSWGRYWGWDPKETWALITMLIYAMTLHHESFGWFRKPLFFHLYCIIAFISVLVTYFGVNFILGGMHSYA